MRRTTEVFKSNIAIGLLALAFSHMRSIRVGISLIGMPHRLRLSGNSSRAYQS